MFLCKSLDRIYHRLARDCAALSIVGSECKGELQGEGGLSEPAPLPVHVTCEGSLDEAQVIDGMHLHLHAADGVGRRIRQVDCCHSCACTITMPQDWSTFSVIKTVHPTAMRLSRWNLPLPFCRQFCNSSSWLSLSRGMSCVTDTRCRAGQVQVAVHWQAGA